MYNKLFAKILDSSVWLESTPTRIVWTTFLAAMDDQGFAQFASIPNLAHRARVTVQEAEEAVAKFESADPYSSDPENEGRRIERVPGGWMVLNATKYREIVTRAVAQEKTRLRVRRFREQKASSVTLGNAQNAPCNAVSENVTEVKRSETPSEAYTNTEAYTEAGKKDISSPVGSSVKGGGVIKAQAGEIFSLYPKKRQVARPKVLPNIEAAIRKHGYEVVKAATERFAKTWEGRTDVNFCPLAATWFNQERFLDSPETWESSGSTAPQRGQTAADRRNELMDHAPNRDEWPNLPPPWEKEGKK